MFKEILVFICGAVFGGVSVGIVRKLYDNAHKNRVGTDTNVIKQVADGIGNANKTAESIQGGIGDVEKTAGEVRDTSAALADLLQRIKEREFQP